MGADRRPAGDGYTDNGIAVGVSVRVYPGTDRYLRLAVGCASNVGFNAGEFVFQQGGEANTFYLILEGRVALDVVFPGRGAVTIETLEGRELLGWSLVDTP